MRNVKEKITKAKKVSQVPTPEQMLLTAIGEFMYKQEEPLQAGEKLLETYHLALESPSFELQDWFERSSMFFTIREIRNLLKAIHIYKQTLRKEAA